MYYIKLFLIPFFTSPPARLLQLVIKLSVDAKPVPVRPKSFSIAKWDFCSVLWRDSSMLALLILVQRRRWLSRRWWSQKLVLSCSVFWRTFERSINSLWSISSYDTTLNESTVNYLLFVFLQHAIYLMDTGSYHCQTVCKRFNHLLFSTKFTRQLESCTELVTLICTYDLPCDHWFSKVLDQYSFAGSKTFWFVHRESLAHEGG